MADSDKMIDVSDGATLTASSGDAIPPTLIPCAPTPGVPFFSVAYVKGLVTAPVTATFGWLFCCMYINCVVQVYAEYRAQELLSFDVDIHLYDADGGDLGDGFGALSARVNGGDLVSLEYPDFTASLKQKPKILPDVGFDVLPDIEPKWADIMVYFAMLATVVRFFFGVTATNHRIRRHIFRRHILNLGTLFLLRAFAIISTMLPNPLESCKPTATGSPWVEAFNILNGSIVTCADVMYSGHTVNITLCAMTWHTYSHVVPISTFDPLFAMGGRLTNKLGDAQRLTTAKLLCWVFTFVGYMCIIGSRFHYTLDVFIGMILTVAVFKYHTLFIRSCHLKETWFNSIMMWSEADAEDIIEYRKNLSGVNTSRETALSNRGSQGVEMP